MDLFVLLLFMRNNSKKQPQMSLPKFSAISSNWLVTSTSLEDYFLDCLRIRSTRSEKELAFLNFFSGYSPKPSAAHCIFMVILALTQSYQVNGNIYISMALRFIWMCEWVSLSYCILFAPLLTQIFSPCKQGINSKLKAGTPALGFTVHIRVGIQTTCLARNNAQYSAM